MNPRLSRVRVPFPAWARFRETLDRDLERLPEEPSYYLSGTVTVTLPAVLLHDWTDAAHQLPEGWSFSNLITYLAVIGAMKVTADAEQAQTS